MARVYPHHAPNAPGGPYGGPAYPGGPARRAPIGVRGAPTGPRADLARADTAAIPHQLYVKIVTGADKDHKSRELTLEVLRYVHGRLGLFAQMGLAVKVNKIRSQDLQNPRLVEAMRARGVTRLPALTTPNNIYLGFKEISTVYERNIQEFTALGRRGERPVEGAVPDDDDLDTFYRGEMTFERAEEDTGEAGLGDTEDMMESFRRMQERRERSDADRRPAGGRRAAAADRPAAADRRAAPPRPAASSRPDNVAPPRAPAAHGAPARRPAADPEDAEIEETISRLAQDIDDNVRTRAFAGGGGDSLEGDGGPDDPQDDLMERAYYSRSQPTDVGV